ncbi:hypothetical protein GCM10009117_01710 [Gangjinia marincola]|uniref:Uncharacterized protein n=1 Tax=Gangjinia marincola TaxID=578463 RepID=A0ABP3XSV4_9FLAO
MKIAVQLVLWIIIGALAYLIFNSIYEPIKFNKVKEKRYAAVIEKLNDIRKSELAYRQVTGKFAGDFNSLVRFIDTAEFTLLQRKDTVVVDEEQTKLLGVDITKEIVKIDTLGYKSVKDSLFGTSDSYKTMMNVPNTDKKFELQAGFIEKNESKIPVFEARVAKAVILDDQDRDLVLQENDVVSVDGVNGKYIKVGSMEEIKTAGNWPKSYGDNDQ